MLDLKAIKERTSKATPGPWRYDGMHYEITAPFSEDGYWVIVSEGQTRPDELPADQFGHEYDPTFDFIAHAREDIPTLISKIECLEHELAGASAYIKELLAEAHDQQMD